MIDGVTLLYIVGIAGLAVWAYLRFLKQDRLLEWHEINTLHEEEMQRLADLHIQRMAEIDNAPWPSHIHYGESRACRDASCSDKQLRIPGVASMGRISWDGEEFRKVTRPIPESNQNRYDGIEIAPGGMVYRRYENYNKTKDDE